MFCPKCGASLPDGTTFCTSCGQPLAPQQGAPQQQPYQQQPYQQQPYQQQPYQQQPYQQPTGGSGNNMMNAFNPQDLGNSFVQNIKKPAEWGIPSYVALGGALLFFISLFLPYLTAAAGFISISANFMSSGAFHIILAFLFFALVGFTGIAGKGLPMICAGGVMLLFTIFEAVGNSEPGLSFGIGFVFMLIGSLAAVGGGVWKFLNEKKGV